MFRVTRAINPCPGRAQSVPRPSSRQPERGQQAHAALGEEGQGAHDDHRTQQQAVEAQQRAQQPHHRERVPAGA
ncbi:hypothetical protein ACLESD_43120, partial [Pyxidicoccus sp. 3LFB2]